MREQTIRSKKVLISNELKPACIRLEGGEIKEILDYEEFDEISDQMVDYGDDYIVPGFIDLHLHGNNGLDSMSDSKTNLLEIGKNLINEGTTSFLITTSTRQFDEIIKALENLSDQIKLQNDKRASTCIGIHLEGPFMNPEFAGAQRSDQMTRGTIPLFKQLYEASDYKIKRITIAPEMDEEHKLVDYLSSQNILISVGHTGAKADEVSEYVDAGATMITHTFNGMKSFSHRDVGPIGVALSDDRLTCEVIADGIHVDFDAIKLLVKAKGVERVIVVTDANRTKGLAPGLHIVNGNEIEVDSNFRAVVKKTGNLAGSLIPMNQSIRNLVEEVGVEPVDAFKMASFYPANLIGYCDKGEIAVGKDADIVVLKKDFSVSCVYKDDEIIKIS